MSEPQPPRRDARDAVTWPVRVGAAWTWRILLIALGIYIFLRIFQRVELVAFSFIIALFLTAVLRPIEMVLRRVPGPRSISALLALIVGLAILFGVGWFVGWQITTHSTELANEVTQFVQGARNWLRNGPFHMNSADLDKIANNITSAVKKNQGAIVSGALQTVRTVTEFVGALLLVLLSTFFLLRDGETVWGWVLHLFPKPAQKRLDIAGHIGWGSFGGYLRGQVIIALFHGVSVMVLLFILQVPLAAALGVLIFLGSFIPLVGLTVTGALCVAVAGLAHGLTAAIVVAVAIIVLVQVEANVLQPLIMSRSVEVHPLAIALAVVTGTLLGGIVGALLAVPLVAFLNSTISALRHGAASIVVAERMPRRSLLRRAARESAAGGPPGPATTAVSADAERPSGLILPGTEPPPGGEQPPPGGSADV